MEGTVTFGNKTLTFARTNPKHRAYLDMNWGAYFVQPPPGSGEDPSDYPWGWYYASQDGASLIAGWGRMDMVAVPEVGVVTAAFADVRLKCGLRLELIMGDAYGFRAALTSEGTGEIVVSRGSWVSWTDDLGDARVPLAQNVTITTPDHVVAMRFEAPKEKFARLLFPHQDAIFSDFEALGATVHVVATTRDDGAIIEEWTTPFGGVEFGYKATVKPVEQEQRTLAQRLRIRKMLRGGAAHAEA